MPAHGQHLPCWLWLCSSSYGGQFPTCHLTDSSLSLLPEQRLCVELLKNQVSFAVGIETPAQDWSVSKILMSHHPHCASGHWTQRNSITYSRSDSFQYLGWHFRVKNTTGEIQLNIFSAPRTSGTVRSARSTISLKASSFLFQRNGKDTVDNLHETTPWSWVTTQPFWTEVKHLHERVQACDQVCYVSWGYEEGAGAIVRPTAQSGTGRWLGRGRGAGTWRWACWGQHAVELKDGEKPCKRM